MAGEKRLIDANTLADKFAFLRKMWSDTEIMAVIDEAPTVDAVEVVRCKHCKNKHEYSPTRWFCGLSGLPIDGDDFCSHGEQICNFCITKKDGG